jgi:polysaccharide pyruvyl transferase WcaK-like protein
MTKILVLHGSSGNFGDSAMLEGVVSKLLTKLPSAQLFVADRPGLRTTLWNWRRVHKQCLPSVRLPYEHLLAELPYVWRYNVQWQKASRWCLSLALGQTRRSEGIRLSDTRSNTPEQTSSQFCSSFDGLHMVGGGYLTDAFPDLLLQLVGLAQGFLDQGKPVLLTGQQIGPLNSRVMKGLARRLLRGARFVGLREPTRSVDFCKEFHLERGRFRVMGDDSFGLPSAEPQVQKCLAAQGLMPGRFLAFNVRVGFYALEHRQYLPTIARLADELSRAFRMPVIVVPIAFNEGDSDDQSGQELLGMMRSSDARLLGSNDLTPSLVRGVLGQAFGAVGVSYHFCTFALSQGVPAIALYDGEYYGQKGRGLCRFWQDNRLAISLRDTRVSCLHRNIANVLEDSAGRQKLRRQALLAHKNWEEVFDQQVEQHFAHAFGDRRGRSASVAQTV